jgi:hypothetical protein
VLALTRILLRLPLTVLTGPTRLVVHAFNWSNFLT